MNDSGESRPHDVHPLYQRLLGGVVLLALAAIIIPAVFDLSHDPGRAIEETNIPPQPEGLKVEVLPLPVPEPIVVPHADIEADIAAQRPRFTAIDGQKRRVSRPGIPVSADNAKTIPKVSAPPKSTPSPKPHTQQAAAVPSKPLSENGAAWVVQVGSFGNDANARALQMRMSKAGFPALVFTDTIASGKTVSRVWAGPVKRKEKAEVMRHELLVKMKLKGLVLNRPVASGAR